MSLDTISQVLKAECCWIQTLDSGKGSLSLVASRGLTPETEAEIASMNIDHDFSEIVIGTGQKIIIPDLSNDGRYGLSSFLTSGYRWLIAVPLLTYRVFGLMGIASRNKKNLHKETAGLALVIGGLIANALNKAELSHKSLETQKTITVPKKENKLDKRLLMKKSPELPDDETTLPNPVLIEADKLPAGKKSPAPPDGVALPLHPAETKAGKTTSGEKSSKSPDDIRKLPHPAVIEADKLKSEKYSTEIPHSATRPPQTKTNVPPVLNDGFSSHAQKMEKFRHSHKKK